MLCTLSRWMISRAEDTGKRLPRVVERHVGRCRACGAFARASMTLAARLRAERSDVLAKVPEFSVDLGPDAAAPAPEARGLAAARRASPRFLFGLRPLPAAAAALIVVAVAGIVIFQAFRREPAAAPQDLAAARAAIKSLAAAPEELQGVVGGAESALDKERRILEKSVVSAVDYLQARLNIKIERRDVSKPI
jgi:hypothetical protein